MSDDPHVPPGPGGLLRSARESAGVSLRDISAQLHLDERTVDSLERDDFEHLPAPTFVRGYLRGYARLLSVPVGPVMEAYDREGFRPPDLVADISEEPERKATDFPVSLVTWAVGLVLIAMVIVWWNNKNQEFGELLGPTEQSSPLAGDSGATSESGNIEGASGATSIDESSMQTAPREQPIGSLASASAERPATTTGAAQKSSSQLAPRSPQQTPSADATTAATTQTAVSSGTDDGGRPAADSRSESNSNQSTLRASEVLAEARAALTQSQQSIPSSSSTSGAQTATASGNNTTQSNSSASTTSGATSDANEGSNGSTSSTSASASSTTRLQVKFANESWVEVVDRDKKKLFYNLAKAGRSLDLSGPGPLRVILGNTADIEVRVNGKSFDISPFISKGVARFTLP